MTIYRIARMVETDAIEVEAATPEDAVALVQKAGIRSATTFSHTVIEEVQPAPSTGYRTKTTADVLGSAKAAK